MKIWKQKSPKSRITLIYSLFTVHKLVQQLHSYQDLWGTNSTFFLETFQFHRPLEQTNGTEIISSMANLSPYFLNLNLSTWQALGANQRNYAEIQITIEPEFSVIAQLKVTSSSTIFK